MSRSKSLNTVIADTAPVRRPCVLWPLVLALLAIGSNAQAGGPTEYRALVSVKKFEGASLFSMSFNFDRATILGAHHSEANLGVINRDDDNRIFAGVGPVWRLQRKQRGPYVDFGISPTILGGSRLGPKDMGGSFFFSLALTVGHRFDDRWAVALRAQHISNGGLNSTNPGLDLLGLTLVWNSN